MTRHARWPEYLAEGAALAIFMVSASAFTALLEHHRSPIVAWVPDPLARRALMGVAMGLTAAAIIYSPLGARSGAHMNPSVTLAFLRLRRIRAADAAFYVLAQFGGGIIGMLAASALIGARLEEPAVHFVQTRPGSAGILAAGAGELIISFITISVVLRVAASARTARLAGAAAGVLVMVNIIVEAPLSGMSMNPARTFGPALLASQFDAIWIYFIAPPLGMLLAAEWLQRSTSPAPCARINHRSDMPCIFCGYHPSAARPSANPRNTVIDEKRDLCTTT
jgi:aquaporin Z